MPNKMLIDAGHPEETRVVVLRGNRVEEFDFESANRKQLRGNIYLAKVTRVEPSLQAAFVDYGGNRHGFLAFSEIHPDYYQIPVADRQALIEDEARQQRDADADADRRSGRRRHRHHNRGADRNRDVMRSDPVATENAEAAGEATENPAYEAAMGQPIPEQTSESGSYTPMTEQSPPTLEAGGQAHEAAEVPAGGPEFDPAPAQQAESEGEAHSASETPVDDASQPSADTASFEPASSETQSSNGQDHAHDQAEEESVESVGGADALEEVQERVPRFRRQYKIQEVIKRRQVMLVQVVKEERGSKGAALTTYLSLAGRYSVLMPNTARGGGISRKITSGEDRNRLKEIAQELEVPEVMGVILRTAGASRTKVEVKRDFEYLLRLWETVRDLTLKSTAPTLVYEEGSLTKRSIRDLYNKDIDEIIVAGEQGYKDAKEFMRMLMPSHAKHVKLYKDTQPIFTRFGIESQLDAMFTPIVQLRSGGYIVINQAEALVAIDVNSGRATREHHIEDTALKTNCEAADEVARQLRLRDLAGLIVIDFIDMDEGRNNRTVERRLKEALRHDRARIQVGRISHFGLLEMSRQRIRTSVLESSTETCPICGGSGHVRSVSSVSLQLLRGIEEMLVKGATHNLIVRTRSEVALYVLNHKRGHLRALEERFRITITISADATVPAQQSFIIDRGEQVHSPEEARALATAAGPIVVVEEEEEDEIYEEEVDEESAGGEARAAPQDGGQVEHVGDRDDGQIHEHAYEHGQEQADAQAGDHAEGGQPRGNGEHEDGQRRRRRRGRGRGRGRGGEGREGGQQFSHDRGNHEHGREPVPDQIAQPNEHSDGIQPDGEFTPQQHQQQQQDYQTGHATGENGEPRDGVRRRRRRGRRGGRRNRQGRNGEGNFQPNNGGGHENGQGGGEDIGHEQGGQNFGGGFDHQPSPPRDFAPPQDYAPPARENAPSYSPASRPETAAPSPAAPAPESEPPRRRSTIREPAPLAGSGEPSSPSPTLPPPPAPTPVVTGNEPGESTQPKRGWWGKRLLGGDKS